MKRIIVFLFILGSCGGVPEKVDNKIERVVQSKPLSDTKDTGTMDVSKQAIVEAMVGGKKQGRNLVGKENRLDSSTLIKVNLNLLTSNIKGKKPLEIRSKLGEPKRIRIEPPGEIWQYGFPQCWLLVFIQNSGSGKIILHADLLKRGNPVSEGECVVNVENHDKN